MASAKQKKAQKESMIRTLDKMAAQDGAMAVIAKWYEDAIAPKQDTEVFVYGEDESTTNE